MKKYNIDGINIIVNKLIPFPGFIAMAVYGTIFWRKEYENRLTLPGYSKYVANTVNHEKIHVAQMRDYCKWLPLGGTIFYLCYLLEWFVRLFINGPADAYTKLSFEQEAYSNQYNPEYLNTRVRFNHYKKYFK